MLVGIGLLSSAAPGADPTGAARRAEQLGFDFVSASDHPGIPEPNFETWTMLSWIAASTSRIRVATRVLGVPYRPPAMVAKMAESLQRLSAGRLILGLGGGYSDEEFRAYGLRVPTPREKVDGLAEAIKICRGLWSEPTFSFSGELFRTEGAKLAPKPEVRIPIWVGTYGPRALDVTGRLADGWIPSLGFAAPEQIPGMRNRIFAAARAAGRDPEEILCVLNVGVRVDPSGSHGSADVLSGAAEAVAQRLLDLIRLGFGGINFLPAGPGRDEQVERLAAEILPLIRVAGTKASIA
jgi:alkanesulfonate monooxygenase SsuD/methylene tetrahydromethanopterin reductase-like flavin-dependent oxidoreductase (luciferase family)